MRVDVKSALMGLALMAALGLSVSACDEAEQGRILRYEKGTYLGQQDTELPPDVAAEIRARTSRQSGI